MKYAVVRTGGKQYKVAEGEIIEVERLEVKPDTAYTFSDVLLVVNDGTPMVGTPLVASASVTGKILAEVKAEKIRVAKYKSKVRYRRVTGHRQLLTRIQIESITAKAEKKVVKEEKKETVAVEAPQKASTKKAE